LSSNHSHQDLTVKGESVERIYGNYLDRRYVVNRRYQRKLVWTLDEKIKFIDSIASGFPVPIILLAENRTGERSIFDIIDGMQRLNAIMGFLENEFSADGCYFDLNTMAATKALLDAGTLRQKSPALSRDHCVKIASYTVPLSIYEFVESTEVDEVFRRINSGGRKLSRQELRIAGATGHFSHAVRKVASKVRGDDSAGDEILLNDMKTISIANRELPYGIDVEELFWVKHGVLTKEQVRESRDEEIVADLISYTLIEPPPSSRSEFLDDYFGFGEGDASRKRFEDVELAVQRHSFANIAHDFQRVVDEIKLVLTRAQQTFGQLLFGKQPPRAPRYFQVVFLSFYKLIISENKEVADHDRLINLLHGSGDNINVPEGGRWGSQDRINCVNSAAGIYAPAFQPAKEYDPARVRWVTQLENIITQSYTEQAAYDFKQGFLRLDGSGQFDDQSFTKILRTLVGIANLGRGTTGYVLVGIADKERDASRVQDLYGEPPRTYERFFVTGIEHESRFTGMSLDQEFQRIVEKVKNSSLSDGLRDYVARNCKLVRYYDKSVFVFESQAQEEPSHCEGKYFVRYGSQLNEIPSERYGELFRRFQSGR
jgi:hypothetical protein